MAAPRIVNVHEAKTHLSKLLEAVLAGAEVVIAKAGKPVAKLVPIGSGRKRRRKLGGLKDLIVPKDFDAPLPESVVAAFEGRAPSA
jgi:prevent-host-death family protein